MAGRVIGTATVKIIADGAGFRTGLKGITSGISTMVHGIGRAIGALGLDTLARDAIKMGTEYRKQIDNARASIIGLTSSQQEADTLMEKMTKFAVATPFDLPGVQSVTTRLLALGKGFGVTSGNVLDYVKVLGDTAAINGKGADSMLNVAQVMGKISGQGRVMTRDMNQLTANFPSLHPWEILAEMTGKTEQELRKLAGKPGGLSGIVSATDFINTLTLKMADNKAAAGAMERRMQTLDGTMQLFKDSMGVALADGLQPFFKTIQQFLSAGSTLDALTALIAVFGNLASTIIDGLAPSFPAIVAGFTALVSALSPLAPIITTLGSMFGQLVQAIAPIVTVFLQGLLPVMPHIRALFTQLIGAIGPLITQLLSGLMPLLPSIAHLFQVLVAAMLPIANVILDGLIGVLPSLIDLFHQIVAAVAPVALQLAKILMPVLPVLVNFISQLVGVVAQLLPLFLDLLNAVAPVVPLLGEALIGAVSALLPLVKAIIPIITKFASILIAALKPVLPAIVKALNLLVAALVPLIEQMGDQLLSILESVLPLLPSLAELFLAIVQAVIPLLPILTQLIGLYVGVQETLLSLLIPALNKIIQVLTIVVGAIGTAIEWVTDFSNVWGVFTIALDAVKTALDFMLHNVLEPIGDFLVNVFAVAWVALKVILYPLALAIGVLVVAWQLLYDNVLQPLGHFIADVFTELWSGLTDALDIVKNAVNFLSDAFNAIWRNVLVPLWHNVLEPVGRFLRNEFEKAWADTRAAVDLLKDGFNELKSVGQIVWDKLRDFWSWLVNTFQPVWEGIQIAVEGMGKGISKVADAIKTAFEKAFNFIKDLWNDTIGGFGVHIPSIGPFGGADFTIPEMARGAIVGSPTLAMLAERSRPEAVIPLTNPGRAMQLMQQAGLDRLAARMNGANGFGGGPLITMPGAVIQDATDADLVAQRTLVALRAQMIAIR